MIVWLAAAALAAPVDSTALADAEVAATALIADCELRGLACDVPRTSLGEAYLVRATAAVLLRGEVDAQASANARLLVPEESAAWEALLSRSPDVEPDPHLLAWTRPPDPVFRERVVVGERQVTAEEVDEGDPPPPELGPRRPPPEPFRPGGPTVVGLQVGGTFSDVPLATRVAGRHTLTGALMALVEVDWGLTSEALPVPEQPSVDLRGHYTRGDVGIGLRRSRSFTEMSGYLGASVTGASLSRASQRALVANHGVPASGAVDVGGFLGFYTWFGSRRGPIGLQVDNRLTLTAHTLLVSDYSTDQEGERIERPGTEARLATLSNVDLTFDLRERPLRFALGTSLITTDGLLPSGIPRIDVIPHVEASLRFGGPR